MSIAGGMAHQLGCTMTKPSAADNFAAVPFDDRIDRCVFGNLLVRQDGIETLGVQVVVDDFMPGRLEFVDRRGGDGVAEASRFLMAREMRGLTWTCLH